MDERQTMAGDTLLASIGERECIRYLLDRVIALSETVFRLEARVAVLTREAQEA